MTIDFRYNPDHPQCECCRYEGPTFPFDDHMAVANPSVRERLMKYGVRYLCEVCASSGISQVWRYEFMENPDKVSILTHNAYLTNMTLDAIHRLQTGRNRGT